MNQQYSQQYSQPNGTFEKVDNMLVNCGSFASIIQIVISVICIICLCTSAYFLYNKKDTRIITEYYTVIVKQHMCLQKMVQKLKLIVF